jgi:hypothetical protein
LWYGSPVPIEITRKVGKSVDGGMRQMAKQSMRKLGCHRNGVREGCGWSQREATHFLNNMRVEYSDGHTQLEGFFFQARGK